MSSLTNDIDCKIIVSIWCKSSKKYVEILIVVRFNNELLTNFINSTPIVKTRTRKSGYYIRIYCMNLTNEEQYYYIKSNSASAPITAVKSFLDILNNSDDIPTFNDVCINDKIEGDLMYPTNRKYLIERFTKFHGICLKKQTVGAKLLNSADASGIVESYHLLSHGFCDLLTYYVEQFGDNDLDGIFENDAIDV